MEVFTGKCRFLGLCRPYCPFPLIFKVRSNSNIGMGGLDLSDSRGMS